MTWTSEDMAEFKARMQKYQGWIANITECQDFQLEHIADEPPFHKVLWPLELSKTFDSMFQVLHDANKELVDRLNSPLVDAVYRAYHNSTHTLTFDYQVTMFLSDLCAQGSIEGLEFSLERGPPWTLTRDETFAECLAAAVEHNQVHMAKRLATAKDITQQPFHRFFHVEHRFANAAWCKKYGRLGLAVKSCSMDMIQWMIPFMSPDEVKTFIFDVALEIDSADLIRLAYPIVKVMTGVKHAYDIIQHIAVHCARVLPDIFESYPYGYLESACNESRRMPIFLYMVEDLKLPFVPVELLKRTWYLKTDQVEYLWTKYTYTDDEKNDFIRLVLARSVTNQVLLQILDRGFVTPQFLNLDLGKRLRYASKEELLKFLSYGIRCDEDTMCAVIANPENTLILLERGAPLTPNVWDTMILTNDYIDQNVWQCFMDRGFSVNEQTLANARSHNVLKWCLARSGLIGYRALTANIGRNHYDNCLLLLNSGVQPTLEHMAYAKRLRHQNILRLLEARAKTPLLGKRKTSGLSKK